MATQAQIESQIASNKAVYESLTQPVRMFDLRPDDKGNGGFVNEMEKAIKQKYEDYKTPKGVNFDFAECFSKTVMVQTAEKRPKIVGWHGSNYKLVTNEEIIRPVCKELNKAFGKGGYKMRGNVVDDRQMYCQFIVDTETIGLPAVSPKDKVSLMFTIQNSYDGMIRPSHTASIGFMRLVCTNGLMAFVMDSEHSSPKQKHNEGFTFSLSGLNEQIKKAEKHCEKFKTLRERSLTVKEMEDLFNDMKENQLIQVRQLDEAKRILVEETAQLGERLNVWGAYNSFNNILNHSYNETVTLEKRTSIDTKVLNFLTDRFDIRLN